MILKHSWDAFILRVNDLKHKISTVFSMLIVKYMLCAGAPRVS